MSCLFVWISHLVFYIGWTFATDINIGDVVIAWNLKWKINITRAGAAAQELAHSWVQIIDHNASHGERHEYTIQSLRNDSIQLMVPRKKLTPLTKIKIYDFTNATFDSMIRKRDELKQDSSNHVVVLPFLWSERQPTHIRILAAAATPFFAIQNTRDVLTDALILRYALLYVNDHVSTKIRDLLYLVIKRWVEKHETHSNVEYFGRIWTLWQMNIRTADEWKDFAVDRHRNAQFLRNVLENIRKIQRNPSYRMRDTDWLLPAKYEIGDEIINYWSEMVNDPKKNKHREYVHILWKWNDVGVPGFKFIDMDPHDIFPFDSNGEAFFKYSGKHAPRGITQSVRIKIYPQHAEVTI